MIKYKLIDLNGEVVLSVNCNSFRDAREKFEIKTRRKGEYKIVNTKTGETKNVILNRSL
jgi:hypothetical protein